jgi:hypothetical protein
MTPMFSPLAPIRRISEARIRSLTRGPVSRVGGALCGLRAMALASFGSLTDKKPEQSPGLLSTIVQIVA